MWNAANTGGAPLLNILCCILLFRWSRACLCPNMPDCDRANLDYTNKQENRGIPKEQMHSLFFMRKSTSRSPEEEMKATMWRVCITTQLPFYLLTCRTFLADRLVHCFLWRPVELFHRQTPRECWPRSGVSILPVWLDDFTPEGWLKDRMPY